jgi:hypothetical protein
MKKLIFLIGLTFFTMQVFCQDASVINAGNPLHSELYSILKDFQTSIAAIIVIAGWFVNNRLNKKHEITKRRIDNRLEALKSVVESVIFEMSKGTDKAFAQKDFKDRLERARATIQIYGYRKEIDVFEEFIAALNMAATSEDERRSKLNKINECLPKLSIIHQSLRSELNLESYKSIKH